MKERTNKTLIVLCIIFGILVLGFGSYFVYDKFIAKNNTDENNNISKANLNSELNDLLYFVQKQEENTYNTQLVGITKSGNEIVIYDSSYDFEYDYSDNKIYLLLDATPETTEYTGEYNFAYISLSEGNGNYRVENIIHYKAKDNSGVGSFTVVSNAIYFIIGDGIEKYSLADNSFEKVNITNNHNDFVKYLASTKNSNDYVVYNDLNNLYLLDIKTNKSKFIASNVSIWDFSIYNNKIIYMNSDYERFEYDIISGKERNLHKQNYTYSLTDLFQYKNDYIIFEISSWTETNEKSTLKIYSYNNGNKKELYNLKLNSKEDIGIVRRISEEEFYIEINDTTAYEDGYGAEFNRSYRFGINDNKFEKTNRVNEKFDYNNIIYYEEVS